MRFDSSRRTILMVVALLVTVGACAGNGLQVQNLTPDELMQAGVTALNERDWSDAISAFERFIIQYPSHPRNQEARFRLAQAHFGKKEYVTAATEYARLAGDFPAGPYADDARFGVCESYARLSPKPALDQEYTRAAIEHCRSLAAYYPTSEFVPRAQEILTEMTNKLAEKTYEAGDFYMKRGLIDSAILYFDATVEEYPTSRWAPRALLRLYEAYNRLSYKEEADEVRARLIRDYPTSAEAKQLSERAVTQAP